MKETFAFLFVGHWLKGDFQQDRKNVASLIWTFLNTFKNKTNAPALILKTSTGGTSLRDRVHIKSLIENIKQNVKETTSATKLPNVYLLHSDLTDVEMNALYNHPKVECHTSFTRGEGFGRPLLEATISGKPMVVSGWSGHMDFIRPEYVNVIDGKLENVHKSAADKFLLEEGQWFTIDYSKAGAYMNNIFEDYKKYLELSRKHRKHSKDNFSFDKMVELMGKLISNDKIKSKPVQVGLQLPKLKKVELPKLKKVK